MDNNVKKCGPHNQILICDGILRILDSYPVLFAYVYGSRVDGTADPDSDLDIGIYLTSSSLPRSLDIELSLAVEIDPLLQTPQGADIRSINRMPLPLLGTIVTEGKLIYSRDEIARVRFETSVRMAYFDFLPVIRQHRSAYIDAALR